MVKKKGGREMNPMDSHRKAERAKQLARNKKERQLQREAMSHIDDPVLLRQQLKEILEEEEIGSLNATQRSRKKTLQKAYDAAIKRQMEKEAKEKQKKADENPLVQASIPLSNIPLPPGMPPLPPGMPPMMAAGPRGIGHPPPMRPPPTRPPPVGRIGNEMPAARSSAPVISAKSTVVPLPKAQHDSTLTSLVPASVQASRPTAKKPLQKKVAASTGQAGFGLVPRAVTGSRTTGTTKAQPSSNASSDVPDNFDDFMNSLRRM